MKIAESNLSSILDFCNFELVIKQICSLFKKYFKDATGKENVLNEWGVKIKFFVLISVHSRMAAIFINPYQVQRRREGG